MDLDKILIELSSITVEEMNQLYDLPLPFNYLLSSVNAEIFVYNMKEAKIYFSENLFEKYSCANDGNLLNFIQRVYPKKEQFQIFESLIHRKEDKETLEFVSNNLRWTRFDIFSDDKYTYGVITDIDNRKKQENAIHSQNLRLYKIFNSMPIPIFFYNKSGQIEFKNTKDFKHHEEIYDLIESSLVEGYQTDLAWIEVFEVLSEDRLHMKFRINFNLDRRNTVVVVHRIMIEIDGEITGKLYIYEDVTENYVNESKMHKILLTNELTIAIKDKVDEINDINVLYNFFLPRIAMVIPSAKRACILKINDEGNIEMVAKHGFEDTYQSNFKIPFKTSFAGKSLQGDFSKSVIINDIQKRFSEMHPDMNEAQKGFVLQSNIAAPIVLKDKLYGLLSIDSDENNTFDEVDLYLIDYIRLQIERSIIKYRDYSKVKRFSIIDPLTGIFNRRHLHTLYNNFVQETEITGDYFTIVIFDLDNLKKVNDQYGHIAGDLTIKKFADFASQEIRDTDIISRFGGDEFVGIFWDIEDAILEKKLNAWKVDLLQEPIEFDDVNILVKFSFGSASYPKDGRSFKELLDVADKKMYSMKQKK